MEKSEIKDKVLMVRIPSSLFDEMQIYKRKNFNPTNAEIIRRALVKFVLNYRLEEEKR